MCAVTNKRLWIWVTDRKMPKMAWNITDYSIFEWKAAIELQQFWEYQIGACAWIEIA